MQEEGFLDETLVKDPVFSVAQAWRRFNNRVLNETIVLPPPIRREAGDGLFRSYTCRQDARSIFSATCLETTAYVLP